MSSPRAKARKPSARSRASGDPALAAAAKPRREGARSKNWASAGTSGQGEPSTDLSARASALAAEIEGGLADGRAALSDEALQALMAALCRSYCAQIEAGASFMPLPARTLVSSTDIMTTASGLLRSQSLAVFELGMWQSWTGR